MEETSGIPVEVEAVPLVPESGSVPDPDGVSDFGPGGTDPFLFFSAYSHADPGLGEPDTGSIHGWAVSWSDLMMTMFVLFVVLYVYQAGNRELRFGRGPGSNELGDEGHGQVVTMTLDQSPSGLYDQTRQAVMDEFASGDVTVDMVEEKAVRITIAGDILFDTGTAEIRPEARHRLAQIAQILRANRYAVNVVGHTDSMPNHSVQYPTNWELSADRAVRTARFLIEQAGIAEERVYVTAHAWHRPLRPNTSGENRRLNRRVEIILVKQRL